jgi:hypothetical protein
LEALPLLPLLPLLLLLQPLEWEVADNKAVP